MWIWAWYAYLEYPIQNLLGFQVVYEELEWECSPLQRQASHLLLVEKSLVIPYFKSEVMTVPATLWDSAAVLNAISAGPEGGWSSESSSSRRNLQAFSCLFNPRLAHGLPQPVHLQITFSEGARLAICDKKQGWSSVIGYFNFVLSTCANFTSLHPLILVLIPSCVKYIAHIALIKPGACRTWTSPLSVNKITQNACNYSNPLYPSIAWLDTLVSQLYGS